MAAGRLGWADAVAGSPSYVGRALRQLMSPLVGGATAARPLGASSGVRPGTLASIVTATSTVWTVTPFAGVIDLEAAAIAGPYPFAFDTNQTGAVTAADASNPRVDILCVRVSDPAEGDGTAAPLIELLYLAGAAVASPVAPATPARSFVIAKINVPVAGGGSPTTTWVAPYTVSAGGVVPALTQAALAAGGGYEGQVASVVADPNPALNGTWLFHGGAWDQQTGDSGWLPISATYTNGFTAGSNAPAYRIMNGICYLRGDYWHPTTAPGTGYVAAQTLPVGARPSGNVFFSTYPTGGGTSVLVTIGGIIEITSTAIASSSSGYNIGGISYPIG